ncbi:hypothetical protein BD779DRAFT_1496748 [Infundibulicybe gibba]|nr:hypothetical protein BD779DRAFT_1496748 [Infundibulicybe gibba]
MTWENNSAHRAHARIRHDVLASPDKIKSSPWLRSHRIFSQISIPYRLPLPSLQPWSIEISLAQALHAILRNRKPRTVRCPFRPHSILTTWWPLSNICLERRQDTYCHQYTPGENYSKNQAWPEYAGSCLRHLGEHPVRAAPPYYLGKVGSWQSPLSPRGIEGF